MEKFDLEEERKKISQKFEQEFESALNRIGYDRIKEDIVMAIDRGRKSLDFFLIERPEFRHCDPNNLESFKKFRKDFLEAVQDSCEDSYVVRVVSRDNIDGYLDDYRLVVKLRGGRNNRGLFSWLFD